MALDPVLLDQLTPDLTVEIDGKPTPLRDTQFVREAPDFKTFAKGAYDAHREVGARIPIKTDGKPESIAEWRKTHLPSIYKAGLLEAPPSDPKEYGVTKPDQMPEGLSWDDGRAEKFSQILHKHGAAKGLAADLMALNQEAWQASHQSLKTDKEVGIAALRKEYPADFDSRMEEVKRFTATVFNSPEELAFFENTGIGNHPLFLSVMMRMAHNALSDSSVMAGLSAAQGGGGLSGDEVRKEVSDIMQNKENPRHKLYWAQDKATMDYVEELYRKAYGSGKVEL